MKRVRQKLHGWVVLDKPLGISSTQALGKVRWLLNADKAGHGGTLDPLASGVLPLAFGEATKTVNWAMDGSKTYRFTVKWGAETSTDDLEGLVTRSTGRFPALDDIREAIPEFIGAIRQQPPSYSAIKVSGERAYDLARAGEVVELAHRTVNIESLQIENHTENQDATFIVQCGKGTYVRSIARDLGRRLGCLGHVTFLRRLAVGPFSEKDAISLEKLEALVHRDGSENILAGILRPIETVLDGIPALAMMEAEAKRLLQGQRVLLQEGQNPSDAEVVLVTHANVPVGLFRVENRVLKAIRMFNLDARS
jgi:tRNA pseudouridine55 synthase